MKKKNLKKLRLLFMIIAWIGLIASLVVKLQNVESYGSYFLAFIDYLSHYTIQTNLLACILLSALLYYGDEKLKDFMNARRMITLYISVTFIVYALLLHHLWQPAALDYVLAIITHYVTPIVLIIDWLLSESVIKAKSFSFQTLLLGLLYPLFYALYVMAYGAMTKRYLYPFLHVPSLGYQGVFIRVLIMTGFFLLLGSVMIITSKVLNKRKLS